MGFKCGIVGLPNVGKSTLFNALTQLNIAAQNYPFCTIEPNIGKVLVPDLRLAALSDIVKPQKIVPTHMEFVDIAGLVKGASIGEGLGNQFLGHIKETDAIAHVVRCFENDDIVHVSGIINPLDDIDTIQTELLLSDIETINRRLHKTQKAARGQKTLGAELGLLERLLTHLNEGAPARTVAGDEDAHKYYAELQLITYKPMLYIANVDENGFKNNPHLNAVIARAKTEDAEVIAISAQLEAELCQLDEADSQAYLAELDLQEPGLNRLIRAGYQLLNLHTYFTAGVKEVRAWTIPKGATAPRAAGAIHSDFEKGFIRAEVIGYDNFIKYQGEQSAKEAGFWRLEGKDYVVQDGDVIHFRFNV